MELWNDYLQLMAQAGSLGVLCALIGAAIAVGGVLTGSAAAAAGSAVLVAPGLLLSALGAAAGHWETLGIAVVATLAVGMVALVRTALRPRRRSLRAAPVADTSDRGAFVSGPATI